MKIIVDLFNQHSGDIKELKRMALQAHLSGADVVKLQLLNSKRIWGDDSRKHFELSKTQTEDIFKYCRDLGIEIMATVFDEEKLEWIDALGVETYKIASCTSKNEPKLCEEIISRGKSTLISTGFFDIDQFPYGFPHNVSYLFCVAEYPTYLYNEKLKKMPDFIYSKNLKKYIGFSDHTIGFAAALIAYFKGAEILEKHFTLTPNASNVIEKAHICSFTPETLRQFKNLIRELDVIKS